MHMHGGCTPRPPRAHRVGERLGHAPRVGLPVGLAVREVDQVAPVGLARDEGAHEAGARLGRSQPAVANLEREHLRPRRHAVERGRALKVRGRDAGDVGAVRARVGHLQAHARAHEAAP